MPDTLVFAAYLAVCAGVTYLIRMMPLVLVRRKIENVFLKSFLYYVPYSVLGVMTIPAVFYSTSSPYSAIAGFVAASVLAYFEKSLLTVAATACAVVLAVELAMNYLL